MFHQPDLEELMLARIERHPLIDFRRGAEVTGLDGTPGPRRRGPGPGARPRRRGNADVHRAGRAGLRRRQQHDQATGRDHHGRPRLHRTLARGRHPRRDGLDTWDGVEQICDPARAATFMQVTGDRYRWEFRLRDGEDEAGLITPAALGQLLRPWTGRSDLDGLQIIRSATYTFRAQMASRFRSGRIFLLGDAAHLTPPFIGQGLAGGLRDADNLAWKLAYVLTGRAGEDLLDTYDSERRPHATALVKKAVRVGWAMTGGQDRAAAVRRIALAAAVRSDRICQAMGSTATPRLKAGALQPSPRRLLPSGIPPALRAGGLIPNPLVSAGDGPPVRLDAILAGRPAVLTARRPDAGLAGFLPPARPGPGADQQHPGPDTPRTGRPAGRRLDRRPSRRRRTARRPARPGRRPGADRPRPPGPRGRGGRDPVPAAAPALVHPGRRRAGAPGHGAPGRSSRIRLSRHDYPLGSSHVRHHLAAAGRGLPAPRGRQAHRPAQNAAIRRALRHPLAPLPAHRRSRTSRRRRHPDRPVVAPPRPGRGGRDGPAAARRHDHPPAGSRQRQGDGAGPARPRPHPRLPGHRPQQAEQPAGADNNAPPRFGLG